MKHKAIKRRHSKTAPLSKGAYYIKKPKVETVNEINASLGSHPNIQRVPSPVKGHMTLDIYPLHFIVRTDDPFMKNVIKEFTRKWLRFQIFKNPRTGEYERTYVGTYAAATKSLSEVRYHLNQLQGFLQHCTFMNVPKELIIQNVHTHTKVADTVPMKLIEGWSPRGEQPDVIAYALKDDYPIKTLTIQTGQGKSATSLFINHHKQERFCLITRPQYLEKWVIDLKKMYQIEDDEILIVQGSKTLTKLIHAAKAGKHTQYKAILISNRTYISYIREYETHESLIEETFGCTPDDFMPLLGIDTLYVDEGHQDSRIMFKIYLYSKVAKIVVMSATFDPDDPFLKKVTEVMYPKAYRYQPKLSNQHTEAYVVRYNFRDPSRIRCQARGNYSHMEFEKSIMRQKYIERNYYNMIASLLEGQYLNSKKPGFKAIVFCYTVAMCTKLRDYLQDRFDNQVKVGRYCQQDDYSVLLESDIVITTLMSAGTGVDIPGLYVGIMTVALRSTQANIQTIGRLRKMADGTTPKFLWLSNSDNPKHKQYDREKFVMFRPITKSVGEFIYSEQI